MSYVTYAEVKAFKGFSDDNDQTLITNSIPRAERWLDRECRRTVVAEADTTRYFDAIGDHFYGNVLHVSDIGDLCAITTLTNGDGTEITAGQYTTYPKVLTLEEPTIRLIKILGSANISWTYSNDYENACSIEGRWALFSSAAVPDDIKQAIIRLVLYLYKVRDTDAFETVVIPDAGIIQAPSGFPVDVARTVRNLRRNF